MNAPFHLERKQDVISWVEAKNKETSVERSKVHYTCNAVRGFFSNIMHTSMPIQTREGPIWISLNALQYLSVPEKQTLLPTVDQLSLHILAENTLKKLKSLELSKESLSLDEKFALNTFLSVFELDIQESMNSKQTACLAIRSTKEISHTREPSLSSSTPEFVMSLITKVERYERETSIKESYEPTEIPFAEAVFRNLQKIKEEFSASPSDDAISNVVTALLTSPREEDHLFLRKWTHRIAERLGSNPEQKNALFKNLLEEYERQSSRLTSAPGYSFNDFSHAILEEMFGMHTSKTGGYDYLRSIMSLRNIYNTDSKKCNQLLSPHMKNALEFYRLLHDSKNTKNSGPLAQLIRKIANEHNGL